MIRIASPSRFRFVRVSLCAALCALSFAASACESRPAPTREWRPEDHGQPRELDPSRTPSAEEGEGDAAEPATAERAAEALWNIRCASCHGRDGRGLGPARPPGATPADFTSAELQKARTDAQLAEVVINGRGMMPAFGKELNPQGVQALVAHIRRFAPAPTPAAAPATAGEAAPAAAPAKTP